MKSSRKRNLIFQTEFSQEQIAELFLNNIGQPSKSVPYKFEGKINNNKFVLRRIAGYSRQTVTAKGFVVDEGEERKIYLKIISWFFYVKWFITLLLAVISVVVTYFFLKNAEFSFIILILYFVTLLAYIIPTRLFEFECYNIEEFIKKTFQAKEIQEQN